MLNNVAFQGHLSVAGNHGSAFMPYRQNSCCSQFCHYWAPAFIEEDFIIKNRCLLLVIGYLLFVFRLLSIISYFSLIFN
jgi:hypothetical protein